MSNNSSKNKTALDIRIMGNKTYLHIISHVLRVKAVTFLSHRVETADLTDCE